MQASVNALSAALSETAIWGEFAILAPFIGTMTLVGIGFFLLRRVLRRANKLKGGA